MQHSAVGVGKTPHALLLLSFSSQRNNNKRAFGQECRYFLLCWMQVEHPRVRL